MPMKPPTREQRRLFDDGVDAIEERRIKAERALELRLRLVVAEEKVAIAEAALWRIRQEKPLMRATPGMGNCRTFPRCGDEHPGCIALKHAQAIAEQGSKDIRAVLPGKFQTVGAND